MQQNWPKGGKNMHYFEMLFSYTKCKAAFISSFTQTCTHAPTVYQTLRSMGQEGDGPSGSGQGLRKIRKHKMTAAQ